ncbi:bifunctional precorrin-2 dehydrogenase/sirohydrochlorin ferrochelatase [Paenibacillus sp. IB182496]|uniref:precorrin-2 dehydrogenase n=1 Tax=Paenibacillus sabuli TaxID=2772509 RepID=A0A927BQ20_9BACL|nr:bifunctional precorrin-2 dehydrogenase/sirohydrochlorin ferrochelatase [Paenibacillus sabuli]MBD2844632.1 bifunctional precorrin-2 dehydrogenase/sirohydrochlorin ferrochelatase [Paenibacillus sabuli]
MPDYYPMMLDVRGARCVVVGGGAVAARKVRGLLAAGASVHLIAPELGAPLADLLRQGSVTASQREYQRGDLAGAGLVFAATADAAVNAAVAKDARGAGLWVNVADDGPAGSFVTPAVVRHGPLVLAVTTGGASPALAARIAGELETRYGAAYGCFARWLGELRAHVRMTDMPEQERRRLLREALDAPPELWRDMPEDETTWMRVIERLQDGLNRRI